ncbi:MAG: hypothetical protein Q7T11_09505, partial [Deltaproteobacteria bacterium]|nr:hypothetical protein [Deltaproteobacteria bacterium]
VEIYNTRKRSQKGQIIEGCYSPREKRITIYAFSSAEILSKRYLNTLWHEVGHVIFDKVLSRRDKITWG